MLLLALLSFSFVYADYIFDTSTPIPPYRITLPLQQKELEIKWNHFGKIRRFTIISESCCVYDELMKALHSYEPAFQGLLTWRDSENDSVLLNSSNELNLALKQKPDKFLRLNTIDDRFNNFQAIKEPTIHCDLQKEVLVGQWNGDKEIEIEVNSNLSAEEKESGFLKHITKKQGKWPIIIIHNSRPEVEKIQIAENQTDEGEVVETATIIMPATKSAKN